MEAGEAMEVYVFGVIFILILLPILYFIPIGISLKEKVLIAIVSFLLAEIGLFFNQFLEIWKTLLILVLLAVVVTYIVETRIRPRLADDKGGSKVLSMDNGDSLKIIAKKDEPNFVESNVDNESDGDYDLGQEAIDRLLSEMNKSKEENVEVTPTASPDNIYNSDLDIQDEDYIEPVEDIFFNKENTDYAIEVTKSADSSFEEEIDNYMIENKDTLTEEELTQNQQFENDIFPEEDLLQLTKSIDADSEIDFEKQLENHTSDDHSYEEHKPYEDELLNERTQLFEHLDEIDGGIDMEDPADMKHIDEVVEGHSNKSIESIEDLLEEIVPIDQPAEEIQAESFGNVLNELEEVGPFEQSDAEHPVQSFETVLDELEEIDSNEQEAVDKSMDSIESLLEELEEIEPFEPMDVNESDESLEKVVEELEEIRPIEQTNEVQPEVSLENVLEELDQIGEYEQMNEEESVQTVESVLEELEEMKPVGQEEPVHSEQLIGEILAEKTELQAIEEKHKIMDDLEDITTSEEIQKGDTIVEEYVQEQMDDERTNEEISPTRSEIQRQMLQTMVSQINFSKSRVTDEEYENLVRAYMQPSLPALEYYTFAYMLIEHYINKGQFEKLTILINELYTKFEKYPVIKLQLDYLIEKYNNS